MKELKPPNLSEMSLLGRNSLSEYASKKILLPNTKRLTFVQYISSLFRGADEV